MADINPALGTAPIAGASPAGESARYDPDYEALEAEVKKMESLTDEKPAWPKVQDLAQKLLAEKTKDVLVASYLGMAALQNAGFAALAQAIAVQRDLIKTFWEALWPEQKRMRARVTALQWFNDRVAIAVNARGVSEQDREGLEKCSAAMKELSDAVAEKFTEEKPDLGAVSRAFVDKIGTLAGGEAPAAEGGEAVAETGGATGAQSAGQGGGGGGPIKGRSDAFRKLQEVANWLKRNDPHSPVAMLVQRAVAWGSMSLEQVLTELVRNSDVRDRIFDELGVKKETPPS
ncbi:MAG: type VI secretion system ImpA family N-terminal domain-containing protein [Planctomycetes bacterium]|jgi:type VI secretion system protein VasJ|nr:type VI secretion system ImpA family N-terminal domain-containing protein [Planctomycetota bacterium]